MAWGIELFAIEANRSYLVYATPNENDEHRQLRSARNTGYARTHTERNCSLSLLLDVSALQNL